MKRTLLCFALSSLLLVSCGPQKSITKNALKKATVKKVIRRHRESAPDFKTLYAKIRGSYDDGYEKQSIGISLRMQKNDTLWLSAKLAGIIPLAKAMITPDHVLFYEKINRQYFDGDFRLLSHWLGTTLNFNNIQNLLLGQATSPLHRKDYRLQTTAEAYVLSSINHRYTHRRLLIDKHSFRLKKQEIISPLREEKLSITYPSYQKVDHLLLPKHIKIVATKKGETTKINIDFKTLKFNIPMRFPFKMPSGYHEIQL